MMKDATSDRAIEAVVAAALELVTDGARVGLGSGHAAMTFIAQLGERVRAGLSVVAVPTSEQSARRAREAGIALVGLDEDDLDLTVDGADEVAPNLDLLKGRGGALVRERIVASASKRQVILVTHDKLVRALGESGPIAVEVIPLARGPATRRLRALGVRPDLRMSASAQPFVTDNQNWILDCVIDEPLADARAARTLEHEMLAVPGVVDTGLFLGTAERVLVGHTDGRVDVLLRRDG
jgi:ribose 5-phosphate isomerase A